MGDQEQQAKVLTETMGGVRLVTLNDHTNRNPISDPAMIEALLTALDQANRDDTVSVLVLTANGSAFSAGGDIKAMRDRTGLSGGTPMQVAQNYRRSIQQLPLALNAMDIPTIAAVNGPAIGAGCDLALMCDIRIASAKARFGETFVTLGIIPGDGGAWFLPRLVGLEKAAELILTGRIIDADEALRCGMVLKVVEPEALLDEALGLARAMAEKPRGALRLAKLLLRHSMTMGLPAFLDLSAAFQALAHHTDDHIKAIEAHFAARAEPPQSR